MDSVRKVLANLSPRGRLALAGAAVAVVVLLFLLFRMATQPSYETLASGLDPADTGSITEVLEGEGIGYELRSDGTAVAVPDSDLDRARIALAESDAGGGNKPGFELFDKQQFGASDFQQKVTYQRALEGELERTIGHVDGVDDVTVQLTLPEDQLFAAESAQPTAAVLLGGGSDSLGAGSVRGIARLVASSVEGLDPADVTITNSSGTLVWPAGEGAGGAGTSKQAAEARYEGDLENRLTALIARTIGPEKGRAQVQADLDADRTTESKLEYAKKGTPLKRSTENETLSGGGSAAGGAAGAAGNIPSYGAGGAGNSDSEYERDSEEARYGVDKTVTHTNVAPGKVNKQTVALVVDKSVPAGEVSALQDAVAAAAGIDPKRGDSITTSRIAFAKPPQVETTAPLGGALDIGRWVLLGAAAIAFLVFAGRHLRRREDETLDAEPIWLRELNAPTSLAELELGDDDRDWQPTDELSEEAEEVAAMEPDRVAQQLRAWMKES